MLSVICNGFSRVIDGCGVIYQNEILVIGKSIRQTRSNLKRDNMTTVLFLYFMILIYRYQVQKAEAELERDNRKFKRFDGLKLEICISDMSKRTYDVEYDSGYSTLIGKVSFRTNSQRKESQSLSPIPTASSISRENRGISSRTSRRSTRIAQSHAIEMTPSSTESFATTASTEPRVYTEMKDLDYLSRLSKAKRLLKELQNSISTTDNLHPKMK